MWAEAKGPAPSVAVAQILEAQILANGVGSCISKHAANGPFASTNTLQSPVAIPNSMDDSAHILDGSATSKWIAGAALVVPLGAVPASGVGTRDGNLVGILVGGLEGAAG